MLEKLHLYTRFFVLVCAAVMSFIMCSDTARASQIKRKSDPGVEHKVLRRLYIPNNQQHQQLFSGSPLPETGLQSETSSKTKTTWNQRDISSIIDHQSKPQLFTGSSFGYSPNRSDNKHANAALSVQRRTQLDDDISTDDDPQNYKRLQPRVNYLPTNRQSYNSNSVIIRKSSNSAAATPFYHSPNPSQVWSPNSVQTSYHQEQETLPVNDFSSKVGDKTAWQRYELSPFSSQTHRYSSALQPTQRRHHSSNRETNELTEPGRLSASRLNQAGNYLSSASHIAAHAPSNRNRLDGIENNADLQRPSIVDSSPGWKSERSSGSPGHKNVQSYLFKDSQSSFRGQSLNTGAVEGQSTFPTRTRVQKPSDSKYSLDFQQKAPIKNTKHSPESVNVLYQTANVAQTDAYLQSYHTLVHSLQDTRESSVPPLDADFQGNSATLGGQPALSGVITPSTSGSMQPQKPAQANKSIYGFKGFENPAWTALKEPSALSSRGLNDSTNSQRYSFDKGRSKMMNAYPSLSQKYSFGGRGLTTKLAKSERQQTVYSTPLPGASDFTKTRSILRSFTPEFKQVRPQKPESDAGLDVKTDYGKFRIFRRVYGLKGFSNQPQGGAKALPNQPEKSARVQQDLKGFTPRSSRIWQPESNRIQKHGFNKTSGSKQDSNFGENEPKPPLKTSGSAYSTHRAAPERYKKYRRIYNFRGFQPVQSRILKTMNKTTWRNKEQSPSQEMPLAFPRSSGPLKVLPHLKPDPRVSNKTKPEAMKSSLLSSFTSSTVRGKRVRGKQDDAKNVSKSTPRSSIVPIVRLPKQPRRAFEGLTHSDILGSASFNSVRATTQTPVTPADEYNNQNITAATKQTEVSHPMISGDAVFDRENSSRGPKERAEDRVEESTNVEVKKMDLRSKAADLKTSDSPQDTEGSGSGDFNLFGFSLKSDGLSDDLLEVDYLRISAGNVSFKSMNVSSNEKHSA